MTISDLVVRCTLAEWLKAGPTLLRACPELRRVELTDRQPSANGDSDDPTVAWLWGPDRINPTGDAALPPAVFDRLAVVINTATCPVRLYWTRQGVLTLCPRRFWRGRGGRDSWVVIRQKVFNDPRITTYCITGLRINPEESAVTESRWATSSSPWEMIRFVTSDGSGPGEGPNRKVIASSKQLRHVAVAICRATSPELGHDAAKNVEWHSRLAADPASWCRALCGDQQVPTARQRAEILRCVIGNPWRLVAFPKVRVARKSMRRLPPGAHPMVPVAEEFDEISIRPSFITTMAISLSKAAYAETRSVRECERCRGRGNVLDGREPDRTALMSRCSGCHGTGKIDDGSLDSLTLLALADCLEENGCQAGPLLSHLRDQGPHFNGCHAVEAVLGKE